MNRALLKKTVADARLLWLSCAAALYAFCWLRVWITSNVDMNQFEEILKNLPEAWERLSPVPFRQLASYPVRIAVTYEEPIVYLAITVWAIARSSDSISGEIGRGTMEMLVAQPVRRLHILFTPALITVVGTALLALVAWCGTATGIAMTSVQREAPPSTFKIPAVGIEIPWSFRPHRIDHVPMKELVDARAMLPATVNLFAFGCFLAGVGTLMSSWDRYRWRTIGIMVSFYVVQAIFEIIGMASDQWSWLRRWTFFTAYEPVAFVSRSVRDAEFAWSWIQLDAEGRVNGFGPLGYDTVLIGLGLLGFVGAALIFSRRDLPAPI